jgi:YgiT-type zinc finger domain-containing protein
MCPQCKGELERGTATYTDTRSGYTIVLQDVPAWVCAQCGEPLFESEAVRGIQDVLGAVDERVARLRRVA